MTRPATLALALAGLAAGAAAAPDRPWSAGAWAGSVPVDASAWRSLLADRAATVAADWLAGYGGSTAVKQGGTGPAWGGGWDAARRLAPWAGVGLHLAFYVPAALHAEVTATGAGGERLAWDEHLTATFALAQAGAWVGWDPPAGPRALLRLRAGPGMASATDRIARRFSDPANAAATDATTTATAQAAALVWNAEAETGWSWTNGVGVFGAVAWGRAAFRNFRYVRDTDLDGNGTNDAAAGEPFPGPGARRPDLIATGPEFRAGVRLAF